MQQSEFEKQVQQKMEGLKLSPANAVWEKVAAGLPAEKKPRRWIFFILLFAGLLTGSFLLWNKFDREDKQVVTNDTAVKENVLQNNTAQNKDKKEIPPVAAAIITGQNNNDGIKIKTGGNNDDKKKVSAKVQSKPKSEVAVNNTTDMNVVSGKVKDRKIKTTTKIKTKVPITVAADEQELIVATEEKKLTENAKTVVRIVAPAQVDDNIIKSAKQPGTASSAITNNEVVVNKDTAITTASSKSEKKKAHSQWQYGIKAAAGSGALKKDLFGNTPLFTADTRAFNTSGIPPPVQIIPKPNNPVIGLALNVGFYAQKNINARWGFSTGLNYAYQSNTIEVGNRVDSVVNFYPGSLYNSLGTAGYYAGGSTINYKNKFHLIEVPLLFQWSLSKKSPLYFEGGPTVGYLISSNALVYNSNSGAYFTDAAVFNKLLVSFNAGAGINLAQKKKLPFSIGYQFKYSAGSVTKNDFGKQHFVNSLLYIKIPFKK
jgi:Outer membrane protein beta-barrel domain